MTTPLNQFGMLRNLTAARGHGFERAATLRPSARLRLDAAYAYTSLDVRDGDVQLILHDAPHTGNLRGDTARVRAAQLQEVGRRSVIAP